MRSIVKIRHCLLLWLISVMAMTLSSCHYGNMRNEVIVENEDYTVTSDSVMMGTFTASSPDGRSIVTNYTTAGIDSIDNIVKFRLLIGGRDIELLPAHYHYLDLSSNSTETQIEAFKHDSIKQESTHAIGLPATVKARIDMSTMLESLKEKGHYVTPTHDTIYHNDFENGTLEMALTTSMAPQAIKLKIDNAASDEGIYTVSFQLEKKLPRKYSGWTLAKDDKDSELPSYNSKQQIMNALYNMSIEQIDAKDNKDEPQAMIASKCYDIALSLAFIRPQQSIEELKSMVVDSVINTDTGPKLLASLGNDMIWAQAAWSVYCATGDKGWLNYAYKVIVKSLNQFNAISTPSESGLYHALCPYTTTHTSQYYPQWATVNDAYETMPLVGNAIIEHTYSLLGQIADEFELNKNYDTQAARIKDAINHRLWNENRGCYSQYLYGGVTSIMSPCVDNMGHALAILWDIADDNRTEALIKETPITNYGVTLLYPNRSGTGIGLNNTVIPMVQAMWNLAAAKASNMGMLRRGMGALILQQALAASCSTSCSATTGEILPYNNARGNASGNLAMYFRVLAGMNFLPNGIEFNPKVPVCFMGDKVIKNFAYRKSILNITIKGSGDDFNKITLDGKALDNNFIDGSLEGEHNIVITMNDNYTGSGVTTIAQKMKELPETPQWLWDGFYGTNYSYNPSLGYRILINGVPTYSMRDSVLGTRDTVTYRNYAIVAINKYGQSYISRPHYITTTARCYSLSSLYPQLASERPMPQHYHHKPIEVTSDTTSLSIEIVASEAGSHVLDVMYSNGQGPLASWLAPCQLLRASANGHNQGVMSLAPTGEGQWLSMRYSSHLTIKLLKGKNTITLQRVKTNNTNNNPIVIDHIRLLKLNHDK